MVKTDIRIFLPCKLLDEYRHVFCSHVLLCLLWRMIRIRGIKKEWSIAGGRTQLAMLQGFKLFSYR